MILYARVSSIPMSLAKAQKTACEQVQPLPYARPVSYTHLKWANVSRFSAICAGVDMPLSTVATPSSEAANRSAHEAGEASGRTARSMASSSG